MLDIKNVSSCRLCALIELVVGVPTLPRSVSTDRLWAERERERDRDVGEFAQRLSVLLCTTFSISTGCLWVREDLRNRGQCFQNSL